MKKKPLLFIIIGVVAILVLGVGGFFAFKMFSSKKAEAPAEGKHEEKAKEEKHGGEKKEHGKEAEKGGEHGAKSEGAHGGAAAAPGMGPMVVLEPFVVNLADPGRSRYAKIVAQLELDSEQTAGLVDGLKPKVRDALIMLFSSKTSEEMVTVGGKEILRNEMIRRVNALLTSGKVSEVYFTEFVVQ